MKSPSIEITSPSIYQNSFLSKISTKIIFIQSPLFTHHEELLITKSSSILMGQPLLKSIGMLTWLERELALLHIFYYNCPYSPLMDIIRASTPRHHLSLSYAVKESFTQDY